MFTIQVNEDITLKQLQEPDASSLFNAVQENRSFLRKWLPWVDDTKDEKDSLGFIRSTIEQKEKEEGLSCGIWYKGKFVGTCSIVDINKERRGEIGYWITEESQGKGIVTCCCQALIRYSFEKLKLASVIIRCAAENVKSHQVIERLGLRCQIVKEEQWVKGKKNSHVEVICGTVTHDQWLHLHRSQNQNLGKYIDNLLNLKNGKTKRQIHERLIKIGVFKNPQSRKNSINLLASGHNQLSRQDYCNEVKALIRH